MPDKSPPPLDWSLRVAHEATRFFSLDMDFRASVRHEQGIEEAEGTLTPFSVMNFMTYLSARGVETVGRRAQDLDALLARMTNEGVLSHAGSSYSLLFGRRYLLNNAVSKSQRMGLLWLANIIGPEVIIRVMAPNVAHLTGTVDGEVHGGSGLLIDGRYVLTAAHVVNDMTLHNTVRFSSEYEASVEEVLINDVARDVALLRVDPPEEVALSRISGLAFRNPQWADRVTILGYPPVPQTAQAYLTVQTGEVVNPDVETRPEPPEAHPLDLFNLPVEPPTNGRWFLFSAVARPGNSGGPIVASDGRVVGLVTRELANDGGVASPFYAGAPTGSIIDALAKKAMEELLPVEHWQ